MSTASGALSHTALWDEKFALLAAYRNEHGDVRIPKGRDYQGVKLGQWVGSQRASRAKGKMSQERIDRLDGLGMVWSVRKRSTWKKRFALLERCKDEHGNTNVPHNFEMDGVSLGEWLKCQKSLHRRGELLTERASLLESIGVTWSKPRTTWEDALVILSAYKHENGDVNAPDGFIYRDLQLGTWLQTQRRERRLGKISSDRIARLDALGMVWNFNETDWERNFALVVEYAKMHGTANVPEGIGLPHLGLGHWASYQRTLKRSGMLSSERQEKLEAVGFSWNLLDEVWDRNLTLLATWAEEHETVSVPWAFVTVEGVWLGSWFKKQLGHARAGTLSSERMEKLTTLGFNPVMTPKARKQTAAAPGVMQ